MHRGEGSVGAKVSQRRGANRSPCSRGDTTEVVVVTLFTLWSAKSKAGPVSTLCRVQQ